MAADDGAPADFTTTIEATKHIPIAQLTPLLVAPSSRSLTAEVTIAWPYSSATDSVAFLLAEPDFRLRRTKGQVRVQFGGPSAKAVAKAGITSGDEVILCLDGAEWISAESTPGTPGRGIDFELKFTKRLLLQFRQTNTQQPQVIDVNQPDQEIVEAPEALSRIRTPSPDIPPGPALHFSIGADTASKIEAEEWASPAFIKRARTSYGSLFDSAYDPFEEEDGTIPGKGRKRAKASRLSRQWRYASKSPSPEPETREPSREPEETGVETRTEHETTSATIVTADESIQTEEFETGNAAETLAEFSQQLASTMPLKNPEMEQTTLIPSQNIQEPQGQDTFVVQKDTFEEAVLPARTETQLSNEASTTERSTQLPDISGIEAMDAVREPPLSPRLNPLSSDGLPLVSPLVENRFGVFGAPERSGPYDVGHAWSGQFLPGASDSTTLDVENLNNFDPNSTDMNDIQNAANFEPFVSIPNFDGNEMAHQPQMDVEDQYGHWQSANDAASQPITPYNMIDQVAEPSTHDQVDTSYHDSHGMSSLPNSHMYPELDDDSGQVAGDTWTAVNSTVNYPELPAMEDGDEHDSHDDHQARSRSASHQVSAALSRSGSLQSDPIDLTEDDDAEQVLSEEEEFLVEENEQDAARQMPNEEDDSVSVGESSESESELIEENLNHVHDPTVHLNREEGYDEEEEYEEEEEIDGSQHYDDEQESEGSHGPRHDYDDSDDIEEEYSDEEGTDDDVSTGSLPPPKEPQFISLLSDDEDEEEIEPSTRQPPSQVEEQLSASGEYSENEDESEGDDYSSDEDENTLQDQPAQLDRQVPDEEQYSDDESQSDTEIQPSAGGQSSEPSTKPVPDDVQLSENESDEDDSMSDAEADNSSGEDDNVHSDSAQNSHDVEMVDIALVESTEEAGDVETSLQDDLIKDNGKVEQEASIDRDTTTYATDKNENPLKSRIAAALRQDRLLVNEILEKDEALGARIVAALEQENATNESLKNLLQEVSVVKDQWDQINQSFEALNSSSTGILGKVSQEAGSTVSNDLDSVASSHALIDAPEPIIDKTKSAVAVAIAVEEPALAELIHATDEMKDEAEKGDDFKVQESSQSLREESPPLEADTTHPIEPEKIEPEKVNEDESMTDHDAALSSDNSSQSVQQAERLHLKSATPEFSPAVTENFNMDGAQDFPTQEILYPILPSGVSTEMSPAEQSPEPAKVQSAQLPTPVETQISQTVEQTSFESTTSFDTPLPEDGTDTLEEAAEIITEHGHEVANDTSAELIEQAIGTSQVDEDNSEEEAISQQLMREEQEHHSDGADLNVKDVVDDHMEAIVEEPETGEGAILEQIVQHEPQHAVENLAQSPTTPVRRSARNIRLSTPGSNISSLLDSEGPTPKGYDASIEMTWSALESPTRNTTDVRKAPDSALKLKLTKALRTELSEFTSLKLLRYNMNKKLDVLAIATTATPEPHRAKGGPRHYQISFNITDASIGPSHVTEVQVFRPYKDALPVVKAGDGVLLRNFQVLSVKGGFALRSEQNETSSWAVYKENGEVEIRGPPVEHGEGENEHISSLKMWYEGLDSVARAKIARANGEDVTGVKTRAKKAL